MSSEDLKAQIKANLPHGKIQQIAKEANVSRDTVRRVIAGQTINPDILKLIYKYCKDSIEYKKKLSQLINL